MGDNTLNAAVDGTVIPASDHNSLRTAILTDNVPRNLSGVATDQAGSVGTSAFSWLSSYIRKMFIGDPANLNSIEEDGSDDVIIKRNNTQVASFDSTGITRASFGTLGQQISSGSGSFTHAASTYTDVTNLSITITSNGNPILLNVLPLSSAAAFSWIGGTHTGGSLDARFRFYRDATRIAEIKLTADSSVTQAPMGTVAIETPVAGTYTYKVQVAVITGVDVQVNNCVLAAYNL